MAETSTPREQMSLVAKVAAIAVGKGKKAKEQQLLCDTLYHEYNLFTGSLIEFPYLVRRPNRCYGEDGALNVRYLIMERLDIDLLALSAKSPLTTSEIAKWGKEILKGLQWLHNIGFLFVDLKPDNFMLKGDSLYFIDREGTPTHPYILHELMYHSSSSRTGGEVLCEGSD